MTFYYGLKKFNEASVNESNQANEVEELSRRIGALQYLAPEYRRFGYLSSDEFANLIRSVESNLAEGGNVVKAKEQGKEVLTQYIEQRKKEIAEAQREIDNAQGLLSRLEKL